MAITDEQNVRVGMKSPEQEQIESLEPIHEIDELERVGVRVTFSIASINNNPKGRTEIQPSPMRDVDLSNLKFEGDPDTGYWMVIGRKTIEPNQPRKTRYDIISGSHGAIEVSPTGEVSYKDPISTNGTRISTMIGLHPIREFNFDNVRAANFVIPLSTEHNTSLIMHVERGPKTKEQQKKAALKKSRNLQYSIGETIRSKEPIRPRDLEAYAAATRDSADDDELEIYNRVYLTINEILNTWQTSTYEEEMFLDSEKPQKVVKNSSHLKYSGGITAEQLEAEVEERKNKLKDNDDELADKLGVFVKSLKPKKY